jgi:hypothetical protein
MDLYKRKQKQNPNNRYEIVQKHLGENPVNGAE